MTGCMSGLPESEQTIADIYNIYKRIIFIYKYSSNNNDFYNNVNIWTVKNIS